MTSTKPSLDPVVKLGLGVLVGSFILIGIGMFLSRPDRSIPPYSIGSQVGYFVAVHIPPSTSDPEIEALIRRFGIVGRGTRHFGHMKIRPTTPDDANLLYRKVALYIFSDPRWTSSEMLSRYVNPPEFFPEEDTFIEEYEMAVRGGYTLDTKSQRGWLGPIGKKRANVKDLSMQVLFEDAFSTEKNVELSEDSHTETAY